METNSTLTSTNNTFMGDNNNNNNNYTINDDDDPTDDNYYDQYFQWSYTDSQIISMCVASTITGCWSIAGSVSILHSILKDRRARQRLYERFVFTVSALDVLASLSMVVGSYLLPKNNIDEYDGNNLMSWGTTETCSIMACLFTFYVGVAWANMNLSLYFYFTVVKGWTDKYVAKHLERILHAVACIIPLGLAAAVAVTQSGNPTVLGHLCAIELYPPACADTDKDIDCIRGGVISLHLWFLMLLLQFIPTVVAIYATIQVTWVVTQSTRRAARAGSDAAVRRQRKVMRQAHLYLLSFLNTFLWPMILAGASVEMEIDRVHRARPFILSFLGHLLLPLQGFFNYFIFQKRTLPICGWVVTSVARRLSSRFGSASASPSTTIGTSSGPRTAGGRATSSTGAGGVHGSIPFRRQSMFLPDVSRLFRGGGGVVSGTSTTTTGGNPSSTFSMSFFNRHHGTNPRTATAASSSADWHPSAMQVQSVASQAEETAPSPRSSTKPKVSFPTTHAQNSSVPQSNNVNQENNPEIPPQTTHAHPSTMDNGNHDYIDKAFRDAAHKLAGASSTNQTTTATKTGSGKISDQINAGDNHNEGEEEEGEEFSATDNHDDDDKNNDAASC